MAISDYIPNIFGSTPEAYQGLLTPQQSAALEKRANIGGLLGFASALAQGMSPQGYRRSALQNILSAAGAGYGAAGQTYEAGIGQLSNLQKLQQSQAQIEAMNQLLANPDIDPQIKALIRINPQEGIKYLMENAPLTRILSKTGVAPAPIVEPRVETPQPASLITPEVRPQTQPTQPEGLITSAAEPVNVVRTPPPAIPAGESDFAEFQRLARLEADTKSAREISDAAKLALAETEADLARTEIRPEKGVELQAYEPVPVLEYREPVAAPVAAPAPAPAAAPVAPRVSDDLARLNARKNALLSQNEELSVLPSKRADELIKRNSDQIDTIDKQINRLAVGQFNFQAVEDLVPPQFKSRVANLRQAAESGTITMNDLTQRLQSLEKDAVDFVTKRTDYTNQDRRVAAGMFAGRPIEELQPAELMQLENKLFDLDIQKRRAGATVIDMGSREMEKEFAKGVVEDTRASFQQAKAAVNTVKTIQTLKPIISAGVYDGVLAGAPRAIDQLATAIGVTGKNTQDKLQRTAVAMQRLASLELQAAEAMKGQGAITENERNLIARAAGGNLRDFTAVEVQSLLDSLERVARQKIDSHQQNWEVMSSDPIGSKYSKYYKIEAPQQKNLKYNPDTGRIE